MWLRFTAASPGGATYPAFDEVWGATICPDCFTCRGDLEVRGPDPAPDDGTERRPKEVRRFHQRCRCEGGSKEERWVAWPGTNVRFDFNCYLELCYCCGIQPTRSGSRWSPFFCEECKPRALNLNRAVGRWVIPIGRHTAMHGLLVRGDEPFDPQVAERFAGAMRGLFEGIDHLDEWARGVVRDKLRELGFTASGEVRLSDYLEAARGRIDQERAFERLCAHFSVAQLIERRADWCVGPHRKVKKAIVQLSKLDGSQVSILCQFDLDWHSLTLGVLPE